MWRNIFQNKLLITTILLGIVARLLAVLLPAQYYDMGTFHAWGNSVAANGLSNTYQSIWSDYLPLPMLSFGLVSAISNYLALPFSFIFRLFWLIIESILIFLIIKNLNLSTSKAHSLLSVALWLFPPFLINTGWWGQIDSIPTLLTVLALILLQSKRKLSSGLCYSLAVAFKPIMLIAGPVFFIIGLKQKALLHLFLTGIIVLSLTGIPATSSMLNNLPESLVHPFQLVVNKALYQASMYPGTSINAFNFWSLGGKFWAKDDIAILSITPQTFGLVTFFCLALYVLYKWAKDNFNESRGFLVAGQLLLIFYTFTTRMHERHLMFALPFLLIASLRSKLGKLLTISLSMIYLANVWGAYYWVNHAQSWPYDQSLLIIFSFILVTTTLLTVFSSFNSKILQKLLSQIYNLRVPILILLFSLALRTINLSHPGSMIFDEVYHSFTAKEFIHNNISAWEWWTTPPSGFAYEWTHPPLAKYGMVIGMLYFGENSLGWRIGSALAGAISILGIYFLTLKLTRHAQIAQTAMFLLSIEGLHLVQSRIGMNDTYMLCFLIWSFVQALSSRWKSSAILFGLALSSKWSALYGIIPLAIIYLQNFKLTGSVFSLIAHVIRVTRLLLIALIVYLLSFVPFLFAGHTFDHLLELHRQMWHYHTNLNATHDYQSSPLEWVIVARPVWYYVQYDSNTKSNIYAQGNPVLLWFGLFSFIFLLITKLKKYYLLLIMISIFTVPWIFSPRIMFFYHYLPSASLLSLATAIMLHYLSPKLRIFLIFIFFLSLLIMSPIYFGYPANNVYWDLLFRLFPSWK